MKTRVKSISEIDQKNGKREICGVTCIGTVLCFKRSILIDGNLNRDISEFWSFVATVIIRFCGEGKAEIFKNAQMHRAIFRLGR